MLAFRADTTGQAISPEHCLNCGMLLSQHGVNSRCMIDPKLAYLPGSKKHPGDFDQWFIYKTGWTLVRSEDPDLYHVISPAGEPSKAMPFEEAVISLKANNRY